MTILFSPILSCSLKLNRFYSVYSVNSLFAIETTKNHFLQPSILADVFAKVPQIADLVVKTLDPVDAVHMMMKTDPALASFCQGIEGRLNRFLRISRQGKYERKLLRKLPALPRLLEKEWREKLLNKGLVREDAQSDATVGLSPSCLTLSALSALLGFSILDSSMKYTDSCELVQA